MDIVRLTLSVHFSFFVVHALAGSIEAGTLGKYSSIDE